METNMITVTILCIFATSVRTEHDLQQQNADQLNPLNDLENENYSTKDQDKRTIFSSGNSNLGWAKHVTYHPSGSKYVIGYTPVGLKYTPVIRPIIKPHGYYYTKPNVHFQIKRPVVSSVWKPIPKPISSPILVSKPVPHVDHVHIKPVPDHIHVKPVNHVDHVHLNPIHHIDHLHLNPVHHVDHIHTVPVPNVDHIQTIPAHHFDHIHTLPAPVPAHHVHPVPLQPVPIPGPQPVVHPIFTSSLFEVTKPNLGVLPLGAAFPSPVLRNVPPPPVLPLKPAVLPQHFAPVPVPLPHPAVIQPQHFASVPSHIPHPAIVQSQHFAPVPVPLPQPAIVQPSAVHHPHPHLITQPTPLPAPQAVFPQPASPPGTLVEYHGTTNFLNLIRDRVPFIPSTSIQPQPQLQPVSPPHYHMRYPLGTGNSVHEPHEVQTSFVPTNHPNFSEQPLEFPPNQNNLMQQLPHEAPVQFQPADQVSTQHFYQQPVNQAEHGGDQGGYVYQRPDLPNIQNAIQPGETDLQLPLHLPQHHGFEQSARHFPDGSEFSNNVFKPSIQLEPPYKK